MNSKKKGLLLILGLLGVLLTGCGSSTNPTPTAADPAQLVEDAMATIQAGFTQTAEAIPPTDSPTETPIPSPTAIRTPPALPEGYQSAILNPLDTPHSYIADTCEYLNAKWNPNNSAPGTIVAIVMYHGIIDGVATLVDQISKEDSRHLLEDLHEQGFEAIDTEQLLNFLEHNAKIPPRSVLLVVDDRKTGEYFNDHFRPFYEKYGWHVVNARFYIEDFHGLRTLPDNISLAAEGWVDHQAHGYTHRYVMDDYLSDELIMSELQGSIVGSQKNFGKSPIAFIWPGGGFGTRSVQMARELGYKLGFTINPRGPIMFNWIPLSDDKDPMRPSYLADGYINDPLMTLPRYWNTDMRSHIDEVRIIGKEAAAYAEQNKAVELEYYDIVCAPTYGAIPTLVP